MSKFFDMKAQEFNHNDELQQEKIQALVEEISSLVSLPAVYYKVLEMVEDEATSAVEIGEVITQDTNLCARLLRIANSAFYGFPSRIDTVSRAITIIGLRELRDLMLATSAIEAFNRIPMDMANMYSFWNHSLYSGICARVLAAHNNVLHSERLFVAGLLHDIGHLIMFLKLPDDLRKCMVEAGRRDCDIYEVEQEIIGFDHAQLGAALLRAWGLPESLVSTIRYHHEPDLAQQFQLEASIVHIADAITKHADLGDYVSSQNYEFNSIALSLVMFSDELAEDVIEEADLQFGEARDIFLPKTSVK